MKRNTIITAALIALLAFVMASCKKSFLETVPKGKAIAVTYDDYNSIMNGSDLYVVGKGGWGVWTPAAIMGDEVSAEAYAYNVSGNNYFGYTQARALFQWQAAVFPLNAPGGDGSNNPNFMFTLLNNLYTFNKIITEVPNATNGTTQQKLELQAEALTERAFTNFQLINYFTQPYNAATASTDPGFPIITAANVQATSFPRGTVQQSYNAMISDLTRAIPDLQIQAPAPTRPSKAAAEALLGKIYLFMGNYSSALTMINNAFADMAKMSAPPVLYDYNTTLAPGGDWSSNMTPNGPNSPFLDVVDVQESLWAIFTYWGPYNGTDYSTDFLTIPSETSANALFNPADWRLQFYTNLETDQQTPIPGGRLHRYNLKWSRIGIELPDLLLMRAELEARANSLTAAVTDVETLRNNRLPGAAAGIPSATKSNQTALIQFIISERTREFAETGARWFDMRRLSKDPVFSGQLAATHKLYNDDAKDTFTTFTLTPARLTLQIPPYYLSQNPGMVNNP